MSTSTPSPKLARRSAGPSYMCQKPWPESCFVQCGDSGVVLSVKGNYRTAFFEAFPDTFIRGEGATVEDAEDKAWAAHQRHLACAGHEFDRRGDSEHGTCRHCGLFKSHILKPVHSCSVCAKPHVNLNFYSAHLCLKHFMEFARDPEQSASRFDDGERSAFYEPGELANAYRRSLWMAETLIGLGLLPADVEEHLAERYLNGKMFDLNFDRERHVILHGFYQEWITRNPGDTVGGMQFSVLVDSFLEGEAEFKDITLAVLHAKGLVHQGPPAARLADLRAKAFALFAPAAVEFKRRFAPSPD